MSITSTFNFNSKLVDLPKIYVAGHRGMVGSAILRQLIANGHPPEKIIVSDRSKLDLENQSSVNSFLKSEKPDQIYLAAAKVGGIEANNSYPAQFLFSNLSIQTNVINGAFINKIKKLLFLGSSCIYPRLARQPIREEDLLTSELEPTNEPYAIAKIAGLKMCETYNRQYGKTHGIDYRCIMPTNLFGPGDNYHPTNSHVIPGLILRFHQAKLSKKPQVTVWGSGKSMREFLFVDDLADACVQVMNLERSVYNNLCRQKISHINVGSGQEIAIKDLAEIIRSIVGYEGKIVFDTSKPDGVSRKLMDSTRIISIGWSPKSDFKASLSATYENFLTNNTQEQL